ncbi:glycosyltransferase [Marivita sp. GX14005]|uniref:glycosyltransferase n=1 Tax=Marivita sp. GX14005 TaxID=2942276 RepID=UPI002018BEDD|nr:glycosyltransferase [Marivita sp. GX14005]MCL3883018.1 glycosyltransferase [Marivita sp. GX14005]
MGQAELKPHMPFLRADDAHVAPVQNADVVLRNARDLAASRRRLDPDTHAPDPALDGLLPPEFCAEHRVFPWSTLGDATLIGIAHEGDRTQLRDMLEAQIGPVLFGDATEEVILRLVNERHGDYLANLAETQVAKDYSCRDINKLTPRRAILATLFFGVSLALIFLFPEAFFIGVTAVAVSNVLACAVFKMAVLLAGYTKPPGKPIHVPLAEKPLVSLMVPMFKEAAIANELVRRLSRLSYPKALLDVVLVLEASDKATRQMIRAQTLPAWMRVIEVPDGALKTKPRALNYALRHTRGDIIGVLDAEDAPATDQIERVVEAFHISPKEVACVQGILDFYNTHSNWISRCFSVEYATWFRVVLAGAARLGFSIPLGGTTVYLRRAALEHVGGWDAHNVTEDADLGVRLARFGYRTILVPTVTREEANNRMIAWIKQRSRWLKGYMITYLVHMRRPFRLVREMGPWKFLGFQFFFLTTILQFTLAPALWCFWLVLFGFSTPFTEALPQGWLGGLLALFLVSELVSLLVGFVGVARTQHEKLMQWVPMMMFYYPLGVFAVYKALSELVFKPFYWDKTQHGLSAPDIAGGDIHITRR